MKFVAVITAVLVSFSAFAGLTEAQKNTIAFEALSRLKNADLEHNPDLKLAVYQLLEKVRGTDKFLEIVKEFHLRDCDPGLLDLAIKGPSSETGVEAMRMLLSLGRTQFLRNKMDGLGNAAAAEIAE